MFVQVLTLLFHEISPHSLLMFEFQLYFHLLIYHIHVLNHIYHALLCHFAMFQVFMNLLDVQYHQHLCLIQNFVLKSLNMSNIPLPLYLVLWILVHICLTPL